MPLLGLSRRFGLTRDSLSQLDMEVVPTISIKSFIKPQKSAIGNCNWVQVTQTDPGGWFGGVTQASAGVLPHQ